MTSEQNPKAFMKGELVATNMNKQQLAARVWDMANNMRSKIEASEYKDVILGLIFYKFLSDKEIAFLKSQDWEDSDIQSLTEDDEGDKKFIQNNLGYFIAYDDLYSTWISKGSDFGFGDVTSALNRFDRHVPKAHERVYSNIFDSLAKALPKLGDTDANRVSAIRDLLPIIDPIPTDGAQGYDVLGFVYEYLLKQFAANAGKKAGEFYTPYAVSRLKAEIIADHLKDRDTIDIFDGAAGSSSLLLNVGGAVARRNGNPDRIRYFAQEYKEATYNLTRMNLVMHDIKVGNIISRRGDTLDHEDWPTDGEGGLEPLRADAVTENPPYSQKWNTKDRSSDTRFQYGVPPKSKADYAFLLHGLHHLKPDGIMTIILPHGVLFRSGEEETIRKNLVENNHIDAIIGLPGNIFFGTGIPTLIMVLRKQRQVDDVLIIDASKGCVKAGKKNELRDCDVKRIFDAYKARVNIPGFAHVVSKEEVRSNGYNLNIPRYIDSGELAEPVDVYASMFGGVPASEVNALCDYWDALPGLKESLFVGEGKYLTLKENATQIIREHSSTQAYLKSHKDAFEGFDREMTELLIEGVMTLHAVSDEDTAANNIMHRAASVKLIDEYDAFQVLAERWPTISADAGLIQQQDGGKLAAVRSVDEHLVGKKKNDEYIEVSEGYVGRVAPFDVVQELFLTDQANEIHEKEFRLLDIPSEISEIISELTDEELEGSYINEDGSGFETEELTNAIVELVSLEDDPEIVALEDYLALLDSKAKKEQKKAFIESHPQVKWDSMDSNKDGTYGKSKVSAYLKSLYANYRFAPDTLGYALSRAFSLIKEEKALKKNLKALKSEIDNDTRVFIENLTEEQVDQVLYAKWILPIISGLDAIPNKVIDDLIHKVEHLRDKYAVTYAEVGAQIRETSASLAEMLANLTGDEFDMAGVSEMRTILGGE